MNKHDRLEKVAEQLFHLDEAIDHLNQVGHCEDVVDILNDRDLRDLTREYWRAVL